LSGEAEETEWSGGREMSSSEQDYLRMIQEGESQFVEFKRAAVEARHLAQVLVALANADGDAVLTGR